MSQQSSETAHLELETIFRSKRTMLTAALTRRFGPSNLDIIETALQDAFLEAADTWPAAGDR